VKIVVLGATGLVGRAVVAALEPRHEVVPVSRTSAIRADLADPASLDALFSLDADAVVCCAANVPLRPLTGLSDEQVLDDLRGKLLGQVALARRAAPRPACPPAARSPSPAGPSPSPCPAAASVRALVEGEANGTTVVPR
jgi:NAD(P)-dependent dehydrogenase (short-subunit alcohol dehydrogenase family)